jgi:hypothetical protein
VNGCPAPIAAAINYAAALKRLNRFEEAKALLRRAMPLALRVVGESHTVMLKMRWNYALALYDGACSGASLGSSRVCPRPPRRGSAAVAGNSKAA